MEENEGEDSFMDRFCELEDLRTDMSGDYINPKTRQKMMREMKRHRIVQHEPYFIGDWNRQYMGNASQVYFLDGGRDYHGQLHLSNSYFNNYPAESVRRCEKKIIQGSCRCANCLYEKYFKK